MKYIMIDDAFPVVFHDALVHAEVARGLGRPTSAGFVSGDGEVFVAYGKSISLDNLPSKDDDSRILTKFLGGGRG
jgi:hypothetical protein